DRAVVRDLDVRADRHVHQRPLGLPVEFHPRYRTDLDAGQAHVRTFRDTVDAVELGDQLIARDWTSIGLAIGVPEERAGDHEHGRTDQRLNETVIHRRKPSSETNVTPASTLHSRRSRAGAGPRPRGSPTGDKRKACRSNSECARAPRTEPWADRSSAARRRCGAASRAIRPAL